ncbi:hypothetical protein QFZ82_000298 [Streptomyces sp. V4I23]|uniref:hypothetical protein n=1 Tax=Streptomyces sp. V4I23 TaxID=3042282 RepID=UPI0027808FD7|nr:hypothetical protein [Streptomyces sp. V4I23]MDQ1005813.1 hypothetical protein [Streptomyces sp. V4I23]
MTVAGVLRRRHGQRLVDRYACVVAAQTGTQVSEPYDTTWAQLAAALRQPAVAPAYDIAPQSRR